jgi:hypothetical protein
MLGKSETKYIIWFLLIILWTIPTAKAYPVIENVSVQPTSLWMGEGVTINLNCYDDNGSVIDIVYAETAGPNIILPNMNFVMINENYTLMIPSSYLDRTGLFTSKIFCINNLGQNASIVRTFTVSNLTSYINVINPNPAYVGDKIEIDYFVKKDNTPLYSGLTFDLLLNDKSIPFQIYGYDTSKGWIFRTDSPNTNGTYSLVVKANYDRTSTISSSSIEVKNPIGFDVVSMDKTWIVSNDEITVTVKASEKGSPIQIKKEYLGFNVGSVNFDIISISQNGANFDVKIKAPNISPGSYELETNFNYGDFSTTKTSSIVYVVPVSGKMVDINGGVLSTRVRFKSNGTDKEFTTDNSGSYSGSLPPGTYDIQLSHTHTSLFLSNVTIDSNFDDPIKYYYLTDTSIPGIKVAGFFVYEVALTYLEARIEMRYDESKVSDETKLNVYKCSNWNSGRKLCNSNWVKVNSEIDTIRNVAKVRTTSLSAYAVGGESSIKVDFNLDKNYYYLDDVAEVKGLTQDDDRNTVGDVDVKLLGKNNKVYGTAKSDGNGIFSIKFDAPDQDGNYTITLAAEKQPYKSFSEAFSFEVVRSKRISLFSPETMKIARGENSTFEVSVMNTGQMDLHNLVISLSGIPKEYYDFSPTIDELKQNEERKVQIHFDIPKDASKTTYGCTFKVGYDNVTFAQQLFGLTITESRDESQTQVQNNPPGTELTGNIILPEFTWEAVYVLIFGVFAISLAYFLKKRKATKYSERYEVKNALLDLKQEIKRPSIKAKKRKSR